MPKVGDKEFPYTEAGERQANIYARQAGRKVEYDTNTYGHGSYQEGGEVQPDANYKWIDGKYIPIDATGMQEGGEVGDEFWKKYARGNAYMWGKLKGEGGLFKGLGAIVKHGNQFKKYQDDPGFKEFVSAKTTKEKLAVIKEYFGEDLGFEFSDYSMEDWDEHFRRQNAVIPTKGHQQGGSVKRRGYGY